MDDEVKPVADQVEDAGYNLETEATDESINDAAEALDGAAEIIREEVEPEGGGWL